MDKNEPSSEEILENIIETSIYQNASDIHFDPGGRKACVQYRINGLLQMKQTFSRIKYAEILSKIKIACNFRIDDHLTPKDGSFTLKIQNAEIFFRISMIPTRYGENIVMRIIKKASIKSLEELGIEEKDKNVLLFALSRPGSVGIVMGPTGSGKTTTLYSLLLALKTDGLMAVTIEDPVEAWLDDIRQIQASNENSFNFSNALRSALRQDPDIILVGEIRDYDTALLAFQAALTGHIVITSIHVYDTYHLIPRLLSMGVPNYLIESLKIMSINQRLIETLCPFCKEETESKGCKNCNYTGIGERVLAYEIGGEETKLEDRILNLVVASRVSLNSVKKYLP